MNINGIDFPADRIAEICRRSGVARLSLFGSILRDDFNAESDVDILVEFLPQTRIGLVGMANLQAELSETIGRTVDLRTPAELSALFRSRVIGQSRVLHAA